ncbi:MAG: hypothetical protein V5A46_08085 [Haloferacaceae archaeon]
MAAQGSPTRRRRGKDRQGDAPAADVNADVDPGGDADVDPGGGATAEASEGPLSREEVFEVLSNRRRQLVIEFLHERNGVDDFQLRQLVDAVAARENDKEVAEVTSTERKRVYAALRQSHLPKLDDMGVIEYDHRRNEFAPTDRLERVRLHLEFVPEAELSWAEFFLALSGIGVTLALLVESGAPPFARLAWSTVAWLFLLGFGLSSAVYAYRLRDRRL